MGTFSFSLRWLLFGQSLFSSSGAFSASGVWCFCLVTFFNLDFALRLAYHIHIFTLFLLIPFRDPSIYLSIYLYVPFSLTYLLPPFLPPSLPYQPPSFLPHYSIPSFLPSPSPSPRLPLNQSFPNPHIPRPRRHRFSFRPRSRYRNTATETEKSTSTTERRSEELGIRGSGMERKENKAGKKGVQQQQTIFSQG